MVMIRPSHPGDAHLMAPLMRPEDAAEVWASSRERPKKALRAGYSRSTECYSAFLEDGSPVCMFGVVGHGRAGAIWLLGTTFMPQARTALMRETPKYLGRWLERWPILGNLVDSRNEFHVRWLKRLGATFGPSVPIRGVEFLEFTFGDLQCVTPPPLSSPQ